MARKSDDEFTAKLLGYVDSLEEIFALPSGFFARLLREGDWSFIIKVHALVESAFSQLLEVGVKPPLPSKFLRTLPLSGGQHSKMRLLRLLGLIESDAEKFVKGLSRIRNLVVHDIRQIEFSLQNYAKSLSGKDGEYFASETCCIFCENQQKGPSQLAAILADPKVFIWRTALFFLAVVSLRIDTQKITKKLEQHERERLQSEVEVARAVMEGLKNASTLKPGLGSKLYEELLRKKMPSREGQNRKMNLNG